LTRKPRSWYSDPPAPGLSTINATCESVFQGTPAWRGPRQDKRCVVVAQGFYEWLDKGKEKQPYFVKRNDGKLMAFGESSVGASFAHSSATNRVLILALNML
jgi:putative SOS response-associated peptidase YedK